MLCKIFKIVAFPNSMTKTATVDDVVRFILSQVPEDGAVAATNPFRGRCFWYPTVEEAIDRLHSEGRLLDLEPFDLLGTKLMWHTESGLNYELARRGTKRLLHELRQERPERGEREVSWLEVLPEIQQDDFARLTGRYRTPLAGMITN